MKFTIRKSIQKNYYFHSPKVIPRCSTGSSGVGVFSGFYIVIYRYLNSIMLKNIITD